jgi:hypothetical protein
MNKESFEHESKRKILKEEKDQAGNNGLEKMSYRRPLEETEQQ